MESDNSDCQKFNWFENEEINLDDYHSFEEESSEEVKPEKIDPKKVALVFFGESEPPGYDSTGEEMEPIKEKLPQSCSVNNNDQVVLVKKSLAVQVFKPKDQPQDNPKKSGLLGDLKNIYEDIKSEPGIVPNRDIEENKEELDMTTIPENIQKCAAFITFHSPTEQSLLKYIKSHVYHGTFFEYKKNQWIIKHIDGKVTIVNSRELRDFLYSTLENEILFYWGFKGEDNRIGLDEKKLNYLQINIEYRKALEKFGSLFNRIRYPKKEDKRKYEDVEEIPFQKPSKELIEEAKRTKRDVDKTLTDSKSDGKNQIRDKNIKEG